MYSETLCFIVPVMTTTRIPSLISRSIIIRLSIIVIIIIHIRSLPCITMMHVHVWFAGRLKWSLMIWIDQVVAPTRVRIITNRQESRTRTIYRFYKWPIIRISTNTYTSNEEKLNFRKSFSNTINTIVISAFNRTTWITCPRCSRIIR